MNFLQYVFNTIFLQGALITVALTIASMALGLLGGLLLSAMQVSRSVIVRKIAGFYIWVFRGTPVLLQLVFVFNVLPQLGVKFSPFTCALIALSLNEAAYLAEIIRGGMLGIDPGQRIAGQMIGLSRFQILYWVTLPQLTRLILPPVGNQLIGMLKTSSLASIVAVQELMMVSQRMAAGTFDYVSTLLAGAVYYLVMTSLCTWLISAFERRLDIKHRSAKRVRLGLNTQAVQTVEGK